MADRYEPKLSVRPLSERKPAVSASAESDPLVELTRMVTGRSTFDPAPTAKNKTVPVAGPAPSGVSSLGNDLESELLNGLQASFAAVREAASAPAAPAPAPPPAARSAPTPQPPAARPQPAAPAPAAERTPRPERITPAPAAPARPAAATAQSAAPAQAKTDRPASPAPQTLADRPSFFRSGSGPTVDLSHIQMRSSISAASPPAEAPPVRTTSGRWDPPEDAKSGAADASNRFAPPRAAAFRPDARPADLDEAEVEYEDELPFPEGEQAEEEFELEDIAPLPEYDEDGELPPFPEDELASLSRRRTNRTVILVAGLVVVAIAGGLGYLMLGDSGATTTPPIITADATPTKVLPEQPLAGSEPTKESDRVDAVENPDETNLVTPGDTAIAELPPAEGANNPISRVIVPAGPGFDGPIVDGPDPLATDDPSDPGSIGPKKVRTVVVRPDGTIVSSEAAVDGAPPPPAAAGVPPVEAAASDPNPPVEVAAAPPADQTDMDSVLDGAGGDIAVDTDPLSVGGEPTDIAGTAPATDSEADTPLTVNPDPIAAAPAPLPPLPRPAKPPVAASGGPLVLTPAKPAPVATPAAAGRGVLVQLSSQKSEDAARSAYAGLQRRYPGILGAFNANIQRADLGDRGIYYRVRVGPFSGGDATRLCEDLRAAGGDCIIAR